MKATIIFVLIELTAFVLSCLHILPEVGIACLVIVGGAAWIGIADYEFSRKIDKAIEEDPIPPYGLGGYVSDEHVSPPQGGDATIPVDRAEIDMKQWALQAREITGGRQRNTALLALMKAIDQEINKRLDSSEIDVKSDDRYDEPQATYPEMTMEQ